MASDKQVEKYPLKDFLYGTLCADSHIEEKSDTTARLTICDNVDPLYAEWKVDKLKPFYNFHTKVRENGFKAYVTESNTEWKELKDIFVERSPLPMFSYGSSLSLALWVCDDGTLSKTYGRYEIAFTRFIGNHEICEKIRQAARRKHLEFSVNEKSGVIVFTKPSTDFLVQKIYKFVPPCMGRKLPQQYQNKYKDFELYR